MPTAGSYCPGILASQKGTTKFRERSGEMFVSSAEMVCLLSSSIYLIALIFLKTMIYNSLYHLKLAYKIGLLALFQKLKCGCHSLIGEATVLMCCLVLTCE